MERSKWTSSFKKDKQKVKYHHKRCKRKKTDIIIQAKGCGTEY